MVYGISMVRNEADIIPLNVLYHLASGIDRMLVVDNGSTNGPTGSCNDSACNTPGSDGPGTTGLYCRRGS